MEKGDQEPPRLQCTEIGLISDRLKDPKKGVEVKDRKGTFIGSELVDWIYIHIVGIEKRKDAVNLAQQLMDGGLYKPIHRDQLGKPFRDGYLLYRFSADFEADGCSLEEEPSDVFGDKVVVSSDKLDDLLPQFSNPDGGVECKTRKAGFSKSYANCFVGKEAVDWLVDNLGVSRATAIELGQKMISMEFFEHASGDKDKLFLDKNDEYYHFISPEVEGPAITPDTTLYDFTVLNIDRTPVDLSIYRDQVVLVVNVASNWGLTEKNYTQLQALYEKHKDKGFTILGFPCNQFGSQEPGTNADIKEFVKKYGVTFPLFDKILVNGPRAIPLYKWLKQRISGPLGLQGIKWNFTKFLINRQGKPVQRYEPSSEPFAFEADIIKEIG